MVVIGDTGVGKSCVMHQYINNYYPHSTTSTIGAQFAIKNVCDNAKLDIWDTAGQERFRSLLPMYLKHSHIICIVLSLTDTLATLQSQLQFWTNYIFITPYHFDLTNCEIIVIFNKLDLYDGIEPIHELITTIVSSSTLNTDNIIYCSSKTGENINEIHTIVTKIVSKLIESQKNKPYNNHILLNVDNASQQQNQEQSQPSLYSIQGIYNETINILSKTKSRCY
jgi:small GTP-binding protein